MAKLSAVTCDKTTWAKEKHKADQRNISLGKEIGKPDQKNDILLGDGDGLFLRIRPNNTKTWVVEYEFQGKRTKYTIGIYSCNGSGGESLSGWLRYGQLSLSQARAIAASWKASRQPQATQCHGTRHKPSQPVIFFPATHRVSGIATIACMPFTADWLLIEQEAQEISLLPQLTQTCRHIPKSWTKPTFEGVLR
jgi:hypothetical protein